MTEVKSYLLVKRGLYYRPDNDGYTGLKDRAGRYLETDASPEHGVTAIHEDEAPEFSANRWGDVTRDQLRSGVAKRDAEILALREALAKAEQQCLDWAATASQMARDKDAMIEQLEAMREALEPSGDTKAAYMGEFVFSLPETDEDGEEHMRRTYVPWTTIKEIMAAIHARATRKEALT